MSRLYFDYNATTPMPDEVTEVMIQALKADWKNPSSVHEEGREAKACLDESRMNIASHLGAFPYEIIFTSGATESNNHVLRSVWQLRSGARKKVIVSAVEHASLIEPLTQIQKEGLQVEFIQVNQKGEIDWDRLKNSVDETTLLVSVMLANNETGMIFPVREVAHIAHQAGSLMHTDAACAVGKIDFSFHEMGVDFLSLSGHKAYAPKGIGALVVRKGIEFVPSCWGGMQEQGKRAGTENMAGIIGMSEGLDYARSNLEQEKRRWSQLRAQLQEGLKTIDPQVCFHESLNQLAGTLNFYLPGVRGQTLVARLDLEGVAASAGSACHSGTLESSSVLLVMGYSEEETEGSIRLSFGKMTTQEEIEELIEIFQKIVPEMKKTDY